MHRARRWFPSAGSVSLIGRLRCRPSVRIVVLGARGSIGGAVVRRARLAGHQGPAVVRPSSGTGGFPTGTVGVQLDLLIHDTGVEAGLGATATGESGSSFRGIRTSTVPG